MKFIFLLLRRKITFILIVFSLISSPLIGYVAKINDYTISLNDLQEFVNVQKFLAKTDSLEDFLAIKSITPSKLLGDYIDMMLLYRTADEKNYSINKKNKAIQKLYNETREEQLATLFVNRQIDIAEEPPRENELRKEYAKIRGGNPKTFEELSNQEKSNLYQLSLLRKIQQKKKEYRLQLEKKYKIKRSPRDKKVVAQVNNIKITSEEVDALLKKEVNKLGISLETLRQQEPTKLKEIRTDAINELIFQKMVNFEIKKANFEDRKIVKNALKFYQYQIAIEEYIKNEVAQNIRISSSELDAAFVEISRTRPEIQKLLPTQQEKFLRSVIIQKKIPDIMSELLNEKKEESIIKRSKNELAKLR